MRLGRLGANPSADMKLLMNLRAGEPLLVPMPWLAIDWIVGKSAVILIASAKPESSRQSTTAQGLVSSAERKMRKICFILLGFTVIARPTQGHAMASRFHLLLMQPWFRLRRGMTLGVRAAVFDEEGRIIMVRHRYAPGWLLPGVGVERG